MKQRMRLKLVLPENLFQRKIGKVPKKDMNLKRKEEKQDLLPEVQNIKMM